MHVLAAVVAAVLAGCANPGPLQPPSNHIPEPARQVTATRAADTVTVAFLPPRRAADGGPLRPGITAALCREDPPGSTCVPVAAERIAAGAGAPQTAARPKPAGVPQPAAPPVSLTDALPAALRSGPLRAVAYRVRLLDAGGHTAGPSAPVFALAGAAPPPVAAFSVHGSRAGAVLRWQPGPGPGDVEVARVSIEAPAARPGAAPAAELLRPTGEAHAGGMLDATARVGVAYSYTAVRRVERAVAGHDLAATSAPSAPVVFTLAGTFPPPAPVGLLAAAQFAGSTGDTAAVDLSWQPALVTDVAGYNVYRQLLPETGSGPATAQPAPERLTAQLVRETAFTDAHPPANARRWQYTVTAVDVHGLESPASAAAVVER